MAMIAVLFDKSQLGANHYDAIERAYAILFEAIDSDSIHGCSLYDGQTSREGYYCIGMCYITQDQKDYFKKQLKKAKAFELLPEQYRFREFFSVLTDPLTIRGHIEDDGNFECNDYIARNPWLQSRSKRSLADSRSTAKSATKSSRRWYEFWRK
jgi:hypothetical protein